MHERGEQLFELISQLDVAVGTLQRTAAFGSTKLLSSANMEGRREAKVVLWEKEGIDERCWCCAPSAAWGDPHVAFSPVRAWRTQGLGWVRRWSWLPQLGISLSGHHHALKELSQSVGHGRRKICPLLTHEGNFCLTGAWQSHVWSSLQVSLKKRHDCQNFVCFESGRNVEILKVCLPWKRYQHPKTQIWSTEVFWFWCVTLSFSCVYKFCNTVFFKQNCSFWKLQSKDFDNVINFCREHVILPVYNYVWQIKALREKHTCAIIVLWEFPFQLHHLIHYFNFSGKGKG